MPLIVHATTAATYHAWILPFHLRVFSQFCRRVYCVLDGWGAGEAREMAAQFPDVVFRQMQRDPDLPTHTPEGIVFDGGKLWQTAWDLAMTAKPDWIMPADADETPTPEVADWIDGLETAGDCTMFTCDWVNLWGNAGQAIGGRDGKWSFENPRQRKRPLAVRVFPGAEYRYPVGQIQHVQLHPDLVGRDHRMIYLTEPKMLHYKYASPRWQSDPLRTAGGQYADERMTADARIVPVPRHWRWPGEPAEVLP